MKWAKHSIVVASILIIVNGLLAGVYLNPQVVFTTLDTSGTKTIVNLGQTDFEDSPIQFKDTTYILSRQSAPTSTWNLLQVTTDGLQENFTITSGIGIPKLLGVNDAGSFIVYGNNDVFYSNETIPQSVIRQYSQTGDLLQTIQIESEYQPPEGSSSNSIYYSANTVGDYLYLEMYFSANNGSSSFSIARTLVEVHVFSYNTQNGDLMEVFEYNVPDNYNIAMDITKMDDGVQVFIQEKTTRVTDIGTLLDDPDGESNIIVYEIRKDITEKVKDLTLEGTDSLITIDKDNIYWLNIVSRPLEIEFTDISSGEVYEWIDETNHFISIYGKYFLDQIFFYGNYDNPPRPYMVSFRFVGSHPVFFNYQLQFDNNTSTTIRSVDRHENTLIQLRTVRDIPAPAELEVHYTEGGISPGLLRNDIHPAIQLNSIGVFLIAVYAGIQYYGNRNRQQEVPEDLEYPQLD